MGNMRSRERFSVKGLGLVEAREIAPGNDAAFTDLGYIDETTFKDIIETEAIKDETGRVTQVLEKSRAVSLETFLKEVSIDEINFISQANGKYHAIRYSGMANEFMYQYYCMNQCKIDPSVTRDWKGTQRLPLNAYALHQDNGLYDIPEYYLAEAAARIETKALKLWVSPRLGYSAGTERVLDMSGFGHHGVLDAGYPSVWRAGTSPERFLRMDGDENYLNFGNILNDDGLSDFVIEVWCNCRGADGTMQEILGKQEPTLDAAGFGLLRLTTNLVEFRIGSGTSEITVSSVSTLMANSWNHIAVAVDRSDLATLYINGVAEASTSVAAIGSGANTLNYYAGRDETNFGQVDIDTIRHHVYGEGGLPADIATIMLRHFNAERGYYGL
jgi:hypothetical protein